MRQETVEEVENIEYQSEYLSIWKHRNALKSNQGSRQKCIAKQLRCVCFLDSPLRNELKNMNIYPHI